MQRRNAITAALLLALAVGVFAGNWGMDQKQAVHIAGPAATELGFDLAELPPPDAVGSSLLGTKSFHWTSRKGETVDRLSYLVVDEALCWNSTVKHSTRHHGCVVVRNPA